MRPRDLGDALRFLTRLRLPPRQPPDALGFGAAAFPVVGLLLGAAALGLDVGASALPSGVRAVAILGLWALLTGGLHYDGLADVLDALGAGSREDRLRVLREATLGTFAVLGIVFVVAWELAALGALAGEARSRALLIAPMLGRLAMLLAAFEAPRAREDGLGAAFVRALEAREVMAASALAIAAAVLLGGITGLASVLLAALVAAGVRRRAAGAFGGVTGDVLGASGKLAEAAVLALWTVR